MESRKAIIAEMEGAIRNTLLRVVNTIAGVSGTDNGVRGLVEIENCTIWKAILENCKKQSDLENRKKVADIEEEKEIIQLPNAKGREMKNSQGK